MIKVNGDIKSSLGNYSLSKQETAQSELNKNIKVQGKTKLLFRNNFSGSKQDGESQFDVNSSNYSHNFNKGMNNKHIVS